MKKLLLAFVILLSANFSFAQKVTLTLENPGVDAGYFKYDVVATVLPGQTWKVGSSNIRIDWTSTPAAGISVKTDNPVAGANTNLSGNANYSAMTTTSIGGGSAISLNITRLGNCHTLTPGQYILGRIRFNRLDTNCTVTMTFRPSSVMQDSITQMQNPAAWTFVNPPVNQGIITSINPIAGMIPSEFNLYQNYPNPFNPSTKIKFDVPKAGHVSLSIYDITGKEVAKLVDGELSPAQYETEWNGSNFASGVYFYRLQTSDFVKVQRMILTK